MSVNSSDKYPHGCLLTDPYALIFNTFTLTNIFLILPPCSLVLHHGLQQYWKHRSSSTAAKMTHSNSLIYNTVAMEVIDVFGRVLCSCSIYGNDIKTLNVGHFITSFSWYGKTFFHVLTCWEHYLAVVHPIGYRSLREQRWIRIRNTVFGCIWLICFVPIGVTTIMILYFEVCLLLSSFFSITFCCCSVLYVLIRAGPQRRSRADQAKQRAFYTVTVIVIVLLIRYLVNAIWGICYLLDEFPNDCLWFIYEFWTNLPSCLVLTLLFLHRTGTLACCKNHIRCQ